MINKLIYKFFDCCEGMIEEVAVTNKNGDLERLVKYFKRCSPPILMLTNCIEVELYKDDRLVEKFCSDYSPQMGELDDAEPTLQELLAGKKQI